MNMEMIGVGEVTVTAPNSGVVPQVTLKATQLPALSQIYLQFKRLIGLKTMLKVLNNAG